MIIYRIQDKYGDGVYTSRVPNDFTSDIQELGGRHPFPEMDDGMRHKWGYLTTNKSEDCEHYIFGFSSIDQLRNWFYRDDWLIQADNNFKLCVFDVSSEFIIAGHTQVAFDRRKAVCMEQLSIKQFFNLK